MKKVLFIFISLIVLVSCKDDEKLSVMPTFRGFTVTWDNPNGDKHPSAGDVIHITAVQHSLGNYIYKVDYNWELSTVVDGQEVVYQHTKNNIVYDHQKTDPSINYIVPKGNNGTVRVKFTAEYTFSSSKLATPPAPPTHLDGYYGSIETSFTSLFGKASGSCSISVAD